MNMIGKISLKYRYYLEMDTTTPYTTRANVWCIDVKDAQVFRASHPEAKEISKDVYDNFSVLTKPDKQESL